MDDLLITLSTEIPPSQTKILVVDDDPAILDLFESLIEPSGYEVITAENGKRGLELLEEHKPRVGLIDKNLPDISGVEVIDRGIRVSPETEFIVITAYASLESAIDVMRMGVFDYIPKPLPALSVVRDRIEEALARNLSVYKHRLLTERLRYAYEQLYKTKADLGVEKMMRDARTKAPQQDLDAVKEGVAETRAALTNLQDVLAGFGNEYFGSLAESVEVMLRNLDKLLAESP